MRRNSLFWGAILLIFGTILLLDNLGILRVNLWNLIWPVFLILAGVWILIGVFGGNQAPVVENVSIPLEGAAQASVHVQHGAGRLVISGGAAAGELVSGAFSGGLEVTRRANGTSVDLVMRPRWNGSVWGVPWSWGARGAYDWTMALNPAIPLSLRLDTGAGESRVDLSELCVNDLRVGTGASSTDLTLPANAGMTRVRLEAGAASLNVRVPGGVAAHIHTSSGLSSIRVDQTRFPFTGTVYESPEYATAAHKVDIDIQVGVGSVDVR